MDKHQIVNVLGEMALLLELKGENPFKVRAYENAARTLEGLTDDLAALVKEEKLTEIKGIGKNLAEHITELFNTEKLKEYVKLKKSIPDGVIQMLSIPGLGPKRVRYLWEKWKIESIGDLELLCARHMVKDMPGFGEKMEEKILAGIKSFKKFSQSHLYIEAAFAAEEIFNLVKKWPEVLHAEIGGSIRRRKEIVKDIDILVSGKKPEKIMEKFVKLPQVESVVQHGDTKSAVVLKRRINCDLRVVDDAEFPFALHYFTGSKEHNVAIRTLAKSKGFKLNEYGLFKGESEKSIVCKNEADLFRIFGLDYIDPELREDMGEIKAAASGKLPKLIEEKDLKGIIHCHSTYSDGENSIEEMALAVKKMGYSYLVINDHSKAVGIAHGLKPNDVKKQHREIDELNKKIKGFRILKGTEVDILADGKLDFDDDLLQSFDVVIAAVHSRFGLAEKEMTDRIIKAISNPHVDILAHPTGRLLLSREPYAVDLRAVIDAAAKYRTAIEINAHPQRLDLDWRWCKYAKEKGVKLAICPDAHSIDGLGDIMFGINVARKGWLEKDNVLNCLGVEDFLKNLK